MRLEAAVLVVVGTRPEAVKLAPVFMALQRTSGLRPLLCLTGQHRDMVAPVLGCFGLKADHDLGLMRPGQSPDAFVARALPALSELLARESPSAVIVQGDTTSALAGALAAFYAQIPVAHVEAGLRTHDLASPWPEEGHRQLVGRLAAVHFAPTEAAARALRREGVPAARIHMTGNSGIDALRFVAGRARPSARRARPLVLATVHRRENLGPELDRIAGGLAAVAAAHRVEMVVPVHPNPAIGARLRARLESVSNVRLLPPMDYLDFARTLAKASLVLTDSGGVQEEAAALGVPALVLRETTERTEGVDAGVARLVGACPETIAAEASRLLTDPAAHAAMARPCDAYGDGRASERIAAVLARRFAVRAALPERIAA